MAAPTSTNEVTVRRLSSVITQLWAKIKDTFAPKSHNHNASDINQETYHSLTSTPVEAQFGVVYGVGKRYCLVIKVPVTSLQYNQGVVVYCTKGNRSAMLMLAWYGTSVRCMHINSDKNDSKWIVKYHKVALPGQSAETATALLLYIYAQDYSTTNNSSRHRIFSLQSGGGVRLNVSTMAVSDILTGAGDVDHDLIDCADSVSHALKFGSKDYNGSSEQTITASDLGAEPTIGTLPYSKGGTNASSQKGAEYNLNVAGATQLTSGASDDLRILFASASPSSSNGIIAGYRKCSQIWSYTKGKLSGSDVNIGGSATWLVDSGNTQNKQFLKWSSADIAKVSPSGTGDISHSKYLAAWETTSNNGGKNVNAVDAGKVTVGNSECWGDYKISVRTSIGTATDTIYFVK